MPEAFAAGTTVKLTRLHSDFPASGSWTLAFFLAGADTLTVAGSPNGDAFDITLTAAATAVLPPGTYRWTERATKSGETYDAATGVVSVTRNLATAADGDAQTWEEKQLAAVESAIAAMIAGKLQRYQIAGRIGEYLNLDELKKLRGELVAAVQRQRNGGRIGRQHMVDFRKPGM
jgi:hypothetical protein